MELDDLKGTWKQVDADLASNLRMDEHAIKALNLSKAKFELQKPYWYEILNVLVLASLTIGISINCITYSSATAHVITGLMSIAITLIYTYIGVIKLKQFHKIKNANMPLLQLQQEFVALQVLILKYRKTEMFMVPVFGVLVLPIMYLSVKHFNIFDHPKLYFSASIILIATSIPATYLLNKKLYDAKLNNANQWLQDINNYTVEN